MKTKLLRKIRKHYHIKWVPECLEWFAFPTAEYALNDKYIEAVSIRLKSIIRRVVENLYSERVSRRILK